MYRRHTLLPAKKLEIVSSFLAQESGFAALSSEIAAQFPSI